MDEDKNESNSGAADTGLNSTDAADKSAADTPLPSPDGTASAPSKNNALMSAFEWIEMFVFCFAAVLLIMTFIARHSPVVGSSMYPTLTNGDILIVSDIGYTPEYGDIIVLQTPKLGYKEPLVKRVIATGGQTLDIDFDSWTVTVDGTELDQSYVNYEEGTSMLRSGYSFPMTIPDGYIFVMGDNRNHSMDSRDSANVGIIDERFVLGKVIFRVFPFDKIGTVGLDG
ncbi:MAG: signal peptidase I [Eubacteriales bacterium]